MLKYDQFKYLPTAEDLPDSDDTPVDNELQDLIPHLLKAILALVWAERWDWFFGVDMGVYYHHFVPNPQNLAGGARSRSAQGTPAAIPHRTNDGE